MEQNDEGYFAHFGKIEKAYRKRCTQAVEEYCFTPNEIVVLLYLSNHPGYDSASDIAHFRSISKGLIARSVETLCEKGYLRTGKDEKDRRLIHLSLTEKSAAVVKRLKACRREFVKELYAGAAPADLEAMDRVTNVMNRNLDVMLRGKKEWEKKTEKNGNWERKVSENYSLGCRRLL